MQFQHRAWAAAIRSKYSPRILAGTPLGTLIYLRLAQTRLLLLRERQFLQGPFLSQNTISLSQIFLNKVAVPAQLPSQKQGSRTVLETRPDSFRRIRALEGALSVQEQHPARVGLSYGESRRFLLQLNADANAFEPAVRHLRRNVLFQAMEPTEQPLEQPAHFSHLVMRIVRQSQRVEDSAMASSSAGSLKHATIARDEVVGASSTRRRHLEMEDRMPNKEEPPAPPVINLTQITESVLQQLDRRLVAARERMGRI